MTQRNKQSLTLEDILPHKSFIDKDTIQESNAFLPLDI